MSVRSEVLARLEERRGESISGGEFAAALGVSRNAVWKAVEQLRREGYEIEAVTNRGYRLTGSSNLLSSEGIAPHLNTRFLGKTILVYPELDSTNNKAKLLAQEGSVHGTAVIADCQTAGKGRLSRSFYSPSGAGLYLSVILKPDLPVSEAVLITSCAAVAVAEALEELGGVEAKIKWVNDVFVGGKKICGILTEAGMNAETGRLDFAVVGIGINVTEKAFPPEISEVATSLFGETGREISRNRLAAAVLNRLEKYYEELPLKTFLPEYIRRSNLLGKKLTVFEGANSYSATALSIDENARLVVRLEDGVVKPLSSGEVSIRSSQLRKE